MQVVDYSIYVGFFHIMDVIFLALEQAYRENSSDPEKKTLMEFARLCTKIMKTYAKVFTIGEPANYRYNGWMHWHQGNKEKAYQSWRIAGEKAHAFPMHYEEGLSFLTLGKNLPPDDPERVSSLAKAKDAFAQGGFDNWVETVEGVSGL
jgi:hypothetical protein